MQPRRNPDQNHQKNLVFPDSVGEDASHTKHTFEKKSLLRSSLIPPVSSTLTHFIFQLIAFEKVVSA